VAASREQRVGWERLIAQWRASGVGAAEFCRRNNLAASRFWYWKKRLEREVPALPVFLPLQISGNGRMAEEGGGTAGAIDVYLADRYRVRVYGEFESAALEKVVAVLEGRRC
jgi:hypothetical protein